MSEGVWVVYSRHGCTLCEEFMQELAECLGPARSAAVQVTDIDSDPALFKKYSQRIPVLTVDDEFVCAIRMDRERVERYMR